MYAGNDLLWKHSPGPTVSADSMLSIYVSGRQDRDCQVIALPYAVGLMIDR